MWRARLHEVQGTRSWPWSYQLQACASSSCTSSTKNALRLYAFASISLLIRADQDVMVSAVIFDVSSLARVPARHIREGDLGVCDLAQVFHIPRATILWHWMLHNVALPFPPVSIRVHLCDCAGRTGDATCVPRVHATRVCGRSGGRHRRALNSLRVPAGYKLWCASIPCSTCTLGVTPPLPHATQLIARGNAHGLRLLTYYRVNCAPEWGFVLAENLTLTTLRMKRHPGSFHSQY